MSAFWSQKCPHCHKGPVFKYPTLSLKFTAMYNNCPVCNQDFEIEPGFYYGSMYVSYFITIFIGLVAGIADYFIVKDPPVMQIMVCIVGAIFIFTPYTFRYSRLVMLYTFGSIKYDPEAGK